jgi:hypothetical protein
MINDCCVMKMFDSDYPWDLLHDKWLLCDEEFMCGE